MKTTQTKANNQDCLLCGQAVKIQGFTLKTDEGVQKFCCAGCLSIYSLLNPDSTNTPLKKKDTKT
ncbi:MAG: metal-binding protein [Methylococcaceae bacterium]